MKNKTKFLATLGLISGLAVTGYAVSATASGSHDREGGHHKGKRMVHMMERYGVLDLTEYKALWVEAMNERMVKGFQRHDTDGDGKISEQDFSKKIARMITWMDKNGDGKVDREDFHRPHNKD